jgi:hypothetical protein
MIVQSVQWSGFLESMQIALGGNHWTFVQRDRLKDSFYFCGLLPEVQTPKQSVDGPD